MLCNVMHVMCSDVWMFPFLKDCVPATAELPLRPKGQTLSREPDAAGVVVCCGYCNDA